MVRESQVHSEWSHEAHEKGASVQEHTTAKEAVEQALQEIAIDLGLSSLPRELLDVFCHATWL